MTSKDDVKELVSLKFLRPWGRGSLKKSVSVLAGPEKIYLQEVEGIARGEHHNVFKSANR
jgi:hypothetical protein